MSDGIVARENRQRTDAYRKDERLEASISGLNETLAPREPDVPADLAPRPHLFVIGLPRSGTTLTHQVLAWGLDVGYVSNVMARFWLAPHAGAMLSQAVLGDRRDGSFASDYGKSLEPAGGHEFAYFWHRWLGINDLEDLLDFTGDSQRADWAGAAAVLRRIQMAFDRPMLFKTNYAAQFLPSFARHFPMPLFVHVVREPVAVAVSILKARQQYYGDYTQWWATYSPDYRALCDAPVEEQIAGQIVGLRQAYADQIAKAPPELTVELAYDELCANPTAAVELVRARCLEVYGSAPDLLHPLPERFTRPARAIPRPGVEAAVVSAVERRIAQERR